MSVYMCVFSYMHFDTEQIKCSKRCGASVYLNRGEAECEHVCELLVLLCFTKENIKQYFIFYIVSSLIAVSLIFFFSEM